MKISQELAFLKEKREKLKTIEKEIEGLKEIAELKDPDLEKELEKKAQKIEVEIKKEELSLFLSGKYDKNDAILSIYAGAGGQDSQDWATMLLRMYERYSEKKGFKTEILHQSFGEGGGPEGRIGTKSATIKIKGNFSYGFLKKESGVHRLVRISPFSSQSLRHTSFASVEVLPVLPKEDLKEIVIKPEEIKLETFRASGPGGQYVNKRDSAVRITHLLTKISVSCQSERLQGLNRQRAMEVLAAKLYQLKEQARQKELTKLKGEKVSASWGNQIRSYVLHPYKMVKDLRTDFETSNVEGVLDGNLNEFVEAEIKLKP